MKQTPLNSKNLIREEAILTPTDNNQLLNLGIEFTNNNTTVDLFVTGNNGQFLVFY